MKLTELDVVNGCLESMGEVKVESLEDDHELIAAARDVLKRTSSLCLSRGWWFNEERVQLRPDPDTGFIMIPQDCLDLDIDKPNPAVTIRGRRLYKTDNPYGQDPFVFDQMIYTIHYIRDVPFEELPPIAANWVSAETISRFQLSFDGDPNKHQILAEHARAAYIIMAAEGMRNMQLNGLEYNHSIQELRNAHR